MTNASNLRLAVAEQASDIIADTLETKYVHDLYVDVEAGVYDLDCSGFVSLVLEDIAPLHLRPVPVDGAAQRPLARDY